MVFKTVNPKNGKLLKTVDLISHHTMHKHLDKAFNSYRYMRNQGVDGLSERIERLQKVRKLLEIGKKKYAETITNEMGKPLKESFGEVEKCISIIDYYTKLGPSYLE